MVSLKSILAKGFAKRIYIKTQKWANNPVETQQKVFHELLDGAKHTVFGKDHNFENIKSHADFVKQVPIRDYEAIKPYVELF